MSHKCGWCSNQVSGDLNNPDTYMAWDWWCCRECWLEMEMDLHEERERRNAERDKDNA